MTSCPKCRNEPMGVDYIAEGEEIPMSKALSTQVQFLDKSEFLPVVIQEHLVYTCRTCGY